MVDIFDETQQRVFEQYITRGGLTPRMVVDLDTGISYRSGEEAALYFGVTRQNINNCLKGRQKTVKGHRIMKSADFRREMLQQFDALCKEKGERWEDELEEFLEHVRRSEKSAAINGRM